MKKNNSDHNLMKSGTSKKSRAGKERKPAGTPRLILGAAVVILVGGTILFWPRGESVPTGIGEQKSVVSTTPDTNASITERATAKPHSSSVDIASESQDIVPEAPDGSGLSHEETAAQKKKIALEIQQKSETNKATSTREKPKTKPKPATEDIIVPQKDGGWAVQIGAYGEAPNADKEAVRLQAKGWDARVRAGNNSNGTMVFRVWIGYFKTRSIAENFARQNKRAIPNAIAVHR